MSPEASLNHLPRKEIRQLSPAWNFHDIRLPVGVNAVVSSLARSRVSLWAKKNPQAVARPEDSMFLWRRGAK
jgi:hypothetical protein